MDLHRCFLPSFGSFDYTVSEEKIFLNLYRGPSIYVSYQVSVHMIEGFQRRILKCEKLTDAKWWQKFTLPLARWANNKKTFILGYHNKILLAIKCYIYTCRCLSKNLALSALIYILQYLYSTERIMAIKQENLKVFNNSCNCWSTLLQNRDHS